MKTTTIVLAGQEYPVKQLTLGQIEDLRLTIIEPSPDDTVERVRAEARRTREIVATAINDPAVTADSMRNMRITPSELNDAVSTILDFSGLIPRKSDSPPDRPPANRAAGE